MILLGVDLVSTPILDTLSYINAHKNAQGYMMYKEWYK